jgi:hypothetical protein
MIPHLFIITLVADAARRCPPTSKVFRQVEEGEEFRFATRSFKPVASNPSFLCGRTKCWASPPKVPRLHQPL